MPDENGDGQEPTQEPEAPAAVVVDVDEAGSTSPTPKSFDQEYVDSLRAESARYRKRAKAAEAKVEATDLEKLSELEKAQAVATKANTEVEQLTNLLNAERTRNTVTLEATKMDFQDPGDALAMIDVDDLNMDDETGKPTVKSVQGALKKLTNAKPYLIKSASADPAPGTADGGARGDDGELTQEQKIAQEVERLQADHGTVPMPTV